MKIRITKGPVTKYQFAGQVDENDAWIKKILEFEALKGGFDGNKAIGLPNWGYNSRIALDPNTGKIKDPINPATGKPWAIDDAIGFFKKDFLPKVQQYPMGMRERAADLLYNAGRDPRIYMLDQYLRTVGDKKGLPNRTSYNIDINKNPTGWANILPQFEAEWNKYSNDINKLPLDQQIKLLDQGKDFYYQNINQVNGKPNPAYDATWQYRVNLWDPYKAPTTASNTVSAPTATGNQTNAPVDINFPIPKFKPITEPGPDEAPPEYFTQSTVKPTGDSSGIGPDVFKYDEAGRSLQKRYDSDKAFAKSYDEGVGTAMNNSKLFSNKEKRKYNSWFDEKYAIDNKGSFLKTVGDASMALKGAISLGNMFTDYFSSRNKIQEAKSRQYQDNLNPQATSMYRGNYMTNSGVFQPDRLPSPNEGMFAYGGDTSINPSSMKIRIISGPEKMAYGGQTNYGLDLGRRKVYSDMPETMSDNVSNTIGAVPRYEANIEAEGGETIYGDMDGDGRNEHMTISGPRHSQGGTPIKAPTGSFIFSDTKKMKIKDPNILKMFGGGSGAATPAQLAKKYNINKYKAIMEDPTADELSKSTAEKMEKNYNEQLALLAIVQESMKGFPDGIPQVAQGLMEANQGLAQAAYGGYLPMAVEGLNVYQPIDPYKGGKEKTPTGKSNKYNRNTDYLLEWEKTIPGISKLSNTDAQKLIYNYILKNDPQAVNRMWKEYGLTKKGKQFKDLVSFTDKDAKGRSTYKFSKDLTPEQLAALEKAYVDGLFGARQLDPYAAPPAPPAKTNDIPPEEKKKEDPPLPKIGQPEPPYPTKQPPFEFLTPDMVNLFATAAVPPSITMGYRPKAAFEKGNYVLEDWLSKAQQRQQAFNIAGDTLGTYGPSSALAANLSFMAGQTGDGVSQDIANTAGRNVDRANAALSAEQQRRDQNNLFNLGQSQELWKDNAIARQQYDNSRRAYLANIAQSFSNAWENRGDLYDINMRDPYFFRDPRTYKTVFKGSPGNIFNANTISGVGTNGAGAYTGIGASANAVYRDIYNSLTDIKDEKERAAFAKQLAASYMSGSRQTNTQSYDAYGFPRSSSRRMSSLNFYNQDDTP